MADTVSPEGAALALLHMIAAAETKPLSHDNRTGANATREWILWTYAQCLETVRHPNNVQTTTGWPIPK